MALLTDAQIADGLASLPGWSRDGDTIRKTFAFKGFPEAVAFVGRLVPGAEAADHHPDLTINYRRVTVVYTTLRKWGMENRDTVHAFREGMKEANEYAKTHVPELTAAIAKYTKLPPQVVGSLPPPNLITDVTPAGVKFWIDLAKEQDAIKGNPDPSKMIFQP